MLLNVSVGLIVIVLTIIIQAFATVYWVSLFEKKGGLSYLEQKRHRAAILLITTAVFLFFIHLVQAGIWAFVYMLLPEVTEFETFEKSLYFSLVTFTTLGFGEITIASSNRILAGLEAVNGITLIGWSTAFMFAILQRLVKQQLKHNKKA